MLQLENRAAPLIDTARIQMRIIYALMLRGIRTRLFGNGLGFIGFSVLWPLVHMLAIMTIHSMLGRIVPVGDSALLFFATGLMPFMAFTYISRWTMLGMLFDRPLLAFPIVKVTDLLFARVILEILGSCITALSLIGVLWVAGVDFMPRDVVQAGCALAASMLLGAGVGIINAIITLAIPMWFTGYALIIILVYLGSGILFDPDKFPLVIQHYLALNPVLQAVEWLRSAYYPDYGSAILDKTYLLAWCLCTICGGLVLERIIRGRLVSAG